MTSQNAQVLIASADSTLASRFAEVLCDSYTLGFTDNWQASIESITRHQHAVLVLEPGLLGDAPVKSMSELKSIAPDMRTIVIESCTEPDIDKISLFKLGVFGFCQSTISPELLKKAVQAICNGELWMPRSLISEIIDDLASSSTPGSNRVAHGDRKSVDCLTPRELEVARMVHQGGNNKTIARKLNISERTVKAHLSAIFRKLHIDNRLHLALYFNDVA